MKREVIPFTTEEAWLAERAKDITSTEVAALFGCNPWMTEFELWHRKKGNVPTDFEANEAMEIGAEFEEPIAKSIAKKNGWEIKPKKAYTRLVGRRIGSSFDFEISSPFQSIFEIKNVGEASWFKYWKEEGENIEAPVNLEFQFQHELLVSGADCLMVGAMVGGNKRKTLKRVPDKGIHEAILSKCEAFWKSIDENIEPKPNFEKDAAFIAQLFNKANKGKEAFADEEITALITGPNGYKEWKHDRDIAQKRMDEIKAKILMGIGTASKVTGDDFSISVGETKGSTYTVTRKPGRMFRINFKGEEDGE
jgi:putative phage-type endonuclease